MSRKARGRRPASRPSGLRALAAFALLLVLGQHVLPALHHALLSHEVCAEHGELVHAGEAPVAPVASGENAGVSPGSEHDDHGHCGVDPALHNDRDALIGARFVEMAPASSASTAALGESEAALLKTALFRLAPKQSPPA